MSPKLKKEELEGFEMAEEYDLPVFGKPGGHQSKAADSSANDGRLSLTSKDSELSASETLMSSHAMKMGLYTINLGTSFGQKLHTLHMLILPLIPVFILLGQNTSAFLGYIDDSSELSDVKTQIGNAVDLSNLVQRLQEERAAVALSSFLNRTEGVETMKDLQPYALNGLDIASYTLLRVCIMLYHSVLS